MIFVFIGKIIELDLVDVDALIRVMIFVDLEAFILVDLILFPGVESRSSRSLNHVFSRIGPLKMI